MLENIKSALFSALKKAAENGEILLTRKETPQGNETSLFLYGKEGERATLHTIWYENSSEEDTHLYLWFKIQDFSVIADATRYKNGEESPNYRFLTEVEKLLWERYKRKNSEKYSFTETETASQTTTIN